jgi:SlyX protein
MPHETRTERRLTDLEVKASFTDDLLDRLNLVVYRQQEQIDRLIVELNQLRRQLPEEGPGGPGAGHNSHFEVPPHY